MQKPKKDKVDKTMPHESVAEVFSLSRDIQVANPYHLDGDIDMYKEENLKHREQLGKDQDIRKEIAQILKVYNFDSQGHLTAENYKLVQRQLALILRPDIDMEEMQYIVEQDWQLDQKHGDLTRDQMSDKIFQLVDVWSIGVDKQQYIAFIKLLKKKLNKALNHKK